MNEGGSEGRHFMISYAHESAEHVRQVGLFADFLRSQGVDVWLDQYATTDRQDWVSWTLEQMRSATRVLVVASPAYRQRFERTSPAGEGRGVQLESLLIREEIMRDQAAAVRRFLPVLLAGSTVDDIPTLLLPYSGTHYRVDDLSVTGCEPLLRVLTGQPVRRPGQMGPPVQFPEGGAELGIVARLLVSGGSPLSRDEVARGFVAAASGDPVGAVVDFGPDGTVSGAVISAPPGDPQDRVGRGIKAVHERVRSAGSPLWARIGGHVPTGVGDDKVFRLAGSAGARALHRVPGANVVVVASPSFHDLTLDGVITYPRANAYRKTPCGGADGTCWLAVTGRSSCPAIPELDVDGSPGTREGTSGVSQHVFVGQNNGFVHAVAGDSVHIGDVITYYGVPPR